MDRISEDDVPFTSTPTSSVISFPPSKLPASPRARPAVPLGPRTRKGTLNSISLTGHASEITNGRRVSFESVVSGRNSPSPSNSSSIYSPIFERRQTLLYQTEEKAVQTDPPNPSPTSLTPVITPTVETIRSCTPGVKVVTKPTTLSFPTPITFAANPIPFRGLTLEAAQWTFTSDQLRNIVSQAIRESANESFIRLLPLEAVEKEIPAEMERLDLVRAATQAQHRFHFQRRTNILQSLNALSSTMPVADNGSSPVASLTYQLAEVTAAMDRFTETLLHVADERAQMTHVQDVHVSSALAMALRKLNGSYSKRTADLKRARSRIEELEAELDEAWKVAQDMAQEIDDLDNFEYDHGMDDEDIPASTEPDGDATVMSAVNAQVLGVTGKAVSSLAVLVASPQTSPTSPNRPPKNPSRPSGSHEGRGDQSSKVLAARRRGSLTSKAGLRLPRSGIGSPASGSEGGITPTTAARRSKGGKPFSGAPDVPSIPSSSFLEISPLDSPQLSEDDPPPVPKIVQVIESEDNEHDLADHNELQYESRQPTPGFDRTLIPSFSSELLTPLGRPSSLDEALHLLEHSAATSYDNRARRIQSMLPPPLNSVDRRTALLEQDSPVVPGMGTLPDHSLDSGIRRIARESDFKVDRWPWSSSKHLIPAFPPPSPTPSFVPHLPPPPEENIQRTGRSASLLQFKHRRNSVPLPSAAIAALLPPGRKVDKTPSEPCLPSQTPRSSLSS